MARADKPDKFKGVTAIMINDFILDDACVCKGNGYNPGEIVTFVVDAADLGSKDYTTPHFDVVFIKHMTKEGMSAMTEALENAGELVARRKFKVDTKHIKVKNKIVWEKADFETPGVIVERLLPEAPQPDEIRVG